jgi:hypothetical protein
MQSKENSVKFTLRGMAFACGVVCLTGCISTPEGTIVPGFDFIANPTTLSGVSHQPQWPEAVDRETVGNLQLTYPAQRITERHQIPVGHALADRLALVANENSLRSIRITKWEAASELRGRFNPKVESVVNVEINYLGRDGSEHVWRGRTVTLLKSYSSHLSWTGFDKHEFVGPIQTEAARVLDEIAAQFRWATLP